MSSASRKAVLICGEIKFAHQTLDLLRKKASVTLHPLTTKAAFLEACNVAKPTAIYRPLDTTLTIGKFDSSLLHALPKSVKFLAHNGAGYDQIDVVTARELDIRVSHTPRIVNAATADTALFLLLSTLRKFSGPLMSCHDGKWRDGLDVRSDTMGRDLAGKTVGIVGMGGIGRVFARRCRAFDMVVQYHNRNPVSDVPASEAKYVPHLDDLLATSDVVSLHLPLSSHTRHFLSTPQFQIMKRGAILINTARGPVVDEAALVEALASGHLGGAGLDVYEDEPHVHPDLLALSKYNHADKNKNKKSGIINNNVTLLPHIGTVSRETQHKLEECVLGNIMTALDTGRLDTPVPEHAGF